MKRPLAYLTAAWSGEPDIDMELAAHYCRLAYEAGFSPICPLLYLPLFLNDSVPEEHKAGIDMRRDMLRRSHTLIVCGGAVDEDVKNDTGKEPTLADCGYLLEFDDNYDETYKFRTGRGLPCMFKDELPATDLYNAVKSRVETIESNLESGDYTTAYGDLDINSLIDYFLIQELTLNDEYKHPKSVYMFFNGTDKLTAGPVWDFDWQTFVRYDQVEAMIRKYGGNTQHCRPENEWLYGASSLSGGYDNDKPYMWYPLLFRDAAFRQAVQTRWPAIYSVLQTLESWIGELADKNRLSDSYNYAMWPQIAKKQSGLSAFNGDEDMSFDEAVASLQKVFTDRLTWMNTQITSGVFVIDAE